MTRTRWLILALLASLAVNVFVGGLVIGRWVDHGWHGGGAHWRGGTPPEGPGPRWLRRMVGEEGMPAVRAAWADHAAVIDPLRSEAHVARRAVADALAADPFVRADYETALAAMRASMERMHAATHAAMVDVVESMSSEQRAAFAERARAWADRRRGPPSPPRD